MFFRYLHTFNNFNLFSYFFVQIEQAQGCVQETKSFSGML